MAASASRSTLSLAAVWVLLAVPAGLILWSFGQGAADPADLLHPSGETSVRLMILTMAIGPLARLLGPRRRMRWLLVRRRWFGVAAFGYAALHLLFYLVDMSFSLALMLDEIDAPGIWTGWLAFVLLLVPALASNDRAMRGLRHGWKAVQRLVYPAAILTLIHWALVEYDWLPGLLHFVPLIALYLAARLRGRISPTQPRTI
jgi:sulfoxide reductase heme-binding subunit YedZ